MDGACAAAWAETGISRRHLDLARLQPLEQQVERHDFGQRGGMARAVGVGRLQHRAGIGVHHDRGIGGLVAFGGGRVVALVAAAAGVGVGGDGGNGEQRRQAEARSNGDGVGRRLPHATSALPNPVFQAGLRPAKSGRFIAPPRRHKLRP